MSDMKDFIERNLKNKGWVKFGGSFGVGSIKVKIYDEHIWITNNHLEMIIRYEDLIKDEDDKIYTINNFFEIKKYEFNFIDKFINDLVSIIDETTTADQKDEIPKRYQTQSGKNFMEILKNEMLTHDEYIGFLKGNVYKYVFRYQKKNGIDDLRKAQTYLDLLEKEVE